MPYFRAPSFRWPYRVSVFAPVLPFVAAVLLIVLAAFNIAPAILGSVLFWTVVVSCGAAALATTIALPSAIWGLWRRSEERTALNVLAVTVGGLLLLFVIMITWASYLTLTSHAT